MLVATADEKITYEGPGSCSAMIVGSFQPRTDEETRADIAGGMEAFVEWPKPNDFHAEPSMIGGDSVRSCLDFCLLCARQWTRSHLDRNREMMDKMDG